MTVSNLDRILNGLRPDVWLSVNPQSTGPATALRLHCDACGRVQTTDYGFARIDARQHLADCWAL